MIEILIYIGEILALLVLNGFIGARLIPYLKYISAIKYHHKFNNKPELFLAKKYDLDNYFLALLFPSTYLDRTNPFDKYDCSNRIKMELSYKGDESGSARPYNYDDFNSFFKAHSTGLHITRFFLGFPLLITQFLLSTLIFLIGKTCFTSILTRNISNQEIVDKQKAKELSSSDKYLSNKYTETNQPVSQPCRVSIYEIIKDDPIRIKQRRKQLNECN